jgi:hypothetical protein
MKNKLIAILTTAMLLGYASNGWAPPPSGGGTGGAVTGMAEDGSVAWTGAPKPDSAGGQTIGTTSAEWGHIYLHDGKGVYFQADQSVSIIPAAGVLTFTAAGEGMSLTASANLWTISSATDAVFTIDKQLSFTANPRIYDGSHYLTLDADGLTGDATITFGANTNNLAISNGTAVLDIAAAATLNVDTSLTVQTGAVTLTGNAGASTLVLPAGSLTLGTMAAETANQYAKLASPTFTGSVIIPSANADPASTAGSIVHDSTVTNHLRGAIRWYDGTGIRQVVDLTAAVAEGCTDDYVVAYDSTADAFYCKEDANTGGVPTTITVADEAADASSFPLFVTAATGDLGPKTDTAFTYDPTTGTLGATKFSGAFNGTVGATTPAAGTFNSITVVKSSGVAGDMGLYEANSTDTHAAGFRGPDSITGDGAYRIKFPDARAAGAGRVLAVTNASESGAGTAADPYVQTGSWITPATVTGAETLTNKTLTAPITTLPRVNGSTALSLTAAQVSGTVIRNTGQALAAVNHGLPAAAAGYNFIATVGTTLAATNYWRFTADTSGTPDDFMCLDGTCGKTYVSVDTPTMGDTLTCWTDQVSSTGLKNEADLGIGTSANTAVKNTVAVEFDIAGTGYSKAIAETAPGNDTVPQNLYGAVAFDIGANGTIDAVEASANATGYASGALAIAGIPAVEAAHTRLGTVTAISTEAGGFVFGTTALNAANTTVVYTDAAVYTPPFSWICITGKGTWTTN